MGGVADTVGLVGQVMMRTGWRKKGARIETPRRLVMVTAPFTHKCYWPMGHPIGRQQCSDALDVKQAKEEHAHVQGAQERQRGKEHADQAHDDHLALKVDNITLQTLQPSQMAAIKTSTFHMVMMLW